MRYKSANIYEKGAETTIQFVPGLDQETIAETEKLLVEQMSDKEKKSFPVGRYRIYHGETFTNVSVDHNHFGKFRHSNSEKFLAATATVSLEKGIKVNVPTSPSNFNSN